VKDQRDPETLGNMLIQLRLLYPDKTAAQRADQLEEWFHKGLPIPSPNGK